MDWYDKKAPPPVRTPMLLIVQNCITETEKWLKPSMHGIVPPPTVGHSACVVGNKMYVFGGYQPSLNKLSHDVYILDMDTITWSKILPKVIICVRGVAKW